jgi:hypothetical protein
LAVNRPMHLGLIERKRTQTETHDVRRVVEHAGRYCALPAACR